jgi:hypothetical protein
MTEPAPTASVWASLGFLSWLSYGFLSGAHHWLMGALSGMVISSAIVVLEYRRRAVKLMDLTAVAYFSAAAIGIFVGARELVLRYHLPMVWGVFAAVAWLTIFLDQPFTQQYARETAPRELWGAPLFHRMNRELTMVWAVIFSFGAVLGALSLYVGHEFELGLVLPMTAMAVGFVFNWVHPRRYRARFAEFVEPEERPRRAHS